MTGRTIPAIVVAEHLNACMAAADKAGERNALRALVAAALELGLIEVPLRNEDGDPVSFTWLAQPQT